MNFDLMAKPALATQNAPALLRADHRVIDALFDDCAGPEVLARAPGTVPRDIVRRRGRTVPPAAGVGVDRRGGARHGYGGWSRWIVCA
jgi:hypothetical protein